MSDISRIIADNIAVKQRMFSDAHLLARIQKLKDLVVKTYRCGGKVLLCGNGGSAADAQHIAAELSGRFNIDRKPLYAEALHCNTSYMTSVSNDYGYENVFSRMLEAAGRHDDILIGISTSGNSANVIKAFEKARELGVVTVAFTGTTGGRMADIADILINVPSDCTPRIQEAHILVGHILCELVEKELFGNE